MTEKVKKPFYKKWWVWLIAIFIIFAAAGGGGEESAKSVAGTDTEGTSSPEKRTDD